MGGAGVGLCVCVWGGWHRTIPQLTYSHLVVSGGGRGQGRGYVYVCGEGGQGGVWHIPTSGGRRDLGWGMGEGYVCCGIAGMCLTHTYTPELTYICWVVSGGGGGGGTICVVGGGQGCVWHIYTPQLTCNCRGVSGGEREGGWGGRKICVWWVGGQGGVWHISAPQGWPTAGQWGYRGVGVGGAMHVVGWQVCVWHVSTPQSWPATAKASVCACWGGVGGGWGGATLYSRANLQLPKFWGGGGGLLERALR